MPHRCTVSVVRALALATTLAAPLAGHAQEDFQPQFAPSLHVAPLDGTIEIDGDLDDSGWRHAARAGGFAEVMPGDQIAPPVESEAWVTYDRNHLYVALIAHDDPSTIRVSLRDRDQIFRDDYFGIMFDTYGDHTKGYELFVNPIGIQGDGRVRADGGEDMAFDIVWYSEGKVTDRGYQVELAIPFASLTFPDRQRQTWRVNFWRDHQRDVRRRYAWSAIDRDNPCWMCQWGTMTGLENIQPGSNFDVIASLTGSQAGTLKDTDDPLSGFERRRPDGDAGISLRHGFTSDTIGEIALNPDFSQVESDAGQIDVNTTFALFFPERRPFFQEGSDLYNTWIDAVYTRSINDPSVAGKLTGRAGRTSAIYTVARDETSPTILPFQERSEFVEVGRTTSHIGRVRHSFGDDSHAGALFTDRRMDAGGGGTVLAADSRLRLLPNHYLEAQVALSRTAEPDDPTLTEGLEDLGFDGLTAAFDGESYWGHAVYLSLERDARTWNADFDYWEYSPRFRTDNGFTFQNDYRQTSLWTGLSHHPNGEWLIDYQPQIGIGRVWSYAGRFKDEWLRPSLWLQLRGQTSVFLQYLHSRERFGGQIFDGIRIGLINIDSRFSETLGTAFHVRWGQGIFRDIDDPELGDQLNISASARYKPTQRLVIEPDLDYARMDSRQTGDSLFEGWILRTRINYNFTREWSLRTILQYNEFSERMDFEPLLTYRLNPFTVFYIGSVSRMNYYNDGDHDGLARSTWKLSRQQFFTKLQVLSRF